MRKVLISILFVLAMVATGCDTVYEKPVPNTVENVVNTHPTGTQVGVVVPVTTCNFDAQCSQWELCKPFKAGSDFFKVKTCQSGCTIEEKPVETKKNTANGYVVTTTVTVIDTCMRDVYVNPEELGDEKLNMQCSLDAATYRECIMLDGPTPADDLAPVDPDPVDPYATLDVECCYDNVVDGQYGAFAWSTSTNVNPDGWLSVHDLAIDADGCFSFELYAVVSNIRVDMTNGLFPQVSDAMPDDFWSTFWVAQSQKPRVCRVQAEQVPIGDFAKGWLVDYTPETL